MVWCENADVGTQVTPTGGRHQVGVDDLFFSTTDAKGVIEQANSVFVKLSRYPREALVGAAHNIIRHPVMPGGAFLLMWETIEAGEPFCAYVDNLAADGSTYGVFATITPLGDDYLSVRGRPFVDALHDAAFSLYGAVRPLELQRRDEGWNAHEAAVLGVEKLAELLAGAGFASYDEFIWVALPAEVKARLEQSSGIGRRPLATGDLAQMLQITHNIDAELGKWSSAMDGLQQAADSLIAAAPQLSETVSLNADAAAEINARDTEGYLASAMVYLRVWAQMAPEVGNIVADLVADLNELRSSCARTRFRIALAILHNLTVGQFLLELIDNVPGSDAARPAIADLGRALDEGFTQTQQQSVRNAALATAVAEKTVQLRDLLDLPQTMIREWLSRGGQTGGPFESMRESISHQVDRTQADIDLLGSLAQECEQIAVPLDLDQVEPQLQRLRELLIAHQPHRPRFAVA